MQYLRAYTRLLLLVISTPLIFLLFLPSLALKILGLNNDLWRNSVLTIWGKVSSAIIGLKVNVNGTKPDTPFILVSNHLSYTDVFVLLSTVNGILVAKNEVRSWPFIGWMMDVIGIIFIDRSSISDVKRVNEQIERNLRPNQGIIFFPEATTSDGESILPFKAGLLAYPSAHRYPVDFASIHYKSADPNKPEKEFIHWWGDMTFFTHLIQLLGMQKFQATVTFGESQVIESDRKKLASELHTRVRDQYLEVKD